MPTDPSKTNAPILDRAGIEAIGLEILRSSTDPPGQRLRRLRGYRGRDSFILRRELWHGGAPMQDLAMSLPRRNSPEAHALRRVLIDTAPAGTFEYAVRSLHHCPGPEAHAFRVELLDRGASLREVAGSLRGCDGKLDHALRQWLLEKGASTVCIANSLRGGSCSLPGLTRGKSSPPSSFRGRRTRPNPSYANFDPQVAATSPRSTLPTGPPKPNSAARQTLPHGSTRSSSVSKTTSGSEPTHPLPPSGGIFFSTQNAPGTLGRMFGNRTRPASKAEEIWDAGTANGRRRTKTYA